MAGHRLITRASIYATSIWLLTAPAYALSCNIVPLVDTVDAAAKSLDKGVGEMAIAVGTLSEPKSPVCDDTDWTGNATCTAEQFFTGQLYSRTGQDTVTDHAIRSVFYEHALTSAKDDSFAFWKSWPEGAHLIYLNDPVGGPQTLIHVDTCDPSIIAPATPDLNTAVHACITKGRCQGAARRVLKSYN